MVLAYLHRHIATTVTFKRFLQLCTVFTFSWLFFPFAYAQEEVNFAKRPEVQSFIHQMVKKHKFKETELKKIFTAVKVRPTVIRSVKAPLEHRPWYIYQKLFITEWRITKGVEFWDKYKTALMTVEKKYGVPANIIVATIGIETKYGQHTGSYPVIDALTNIGFSQSPRANFFRSELEEFLLLTREKNLDPLKVLGSYAGAIGQPQFMPSSYRRYAVSYHGKTPIDLSHNELDVIASIANYYKQKGWITNNPITSPASLVKNQFQFLENKHKEITVIKKSMPAAYGVTNKTEAQKNSPYKIIELQNFWTHEYWFTFHNFDVIKRYNNSDLYAMAVFQLSRYILDMREKRGVT